MNQQYIWVYHRSRPFVTDLRRGLCKQLHILPSSDLGEKTETGKSCINVTVTKNNSYEGLMRVSIYRHAKIMSGH